MYVIPILPTKLHWPMHCSIHCDIFFEWPISMINLIMIITTIYACKYACSYYYYWCCCQCWRCPRPHPLRLKDANHHHHDVVNSNNGCLVCCILRLLQNLACLHACIYAYYSNLLWWWSLFHFFFMLSCLVKNTSNWSFLCKAHKKI